MKNLKIDSKYTNVFEEIEFCDDLCISEFNVWGVPIPYFVYTNKGNIYI